MRTFEPGQCHHRDADGKPDCPKRVEAKHANLCPEHEAIWQRQARERRLERGGMRSRDGICAARPNGPYGIDAARKCTRPVHRPWAFLCTEHEAIWKQIERDRDRARRAGASAAEARAKLRWSDRDDARAPDPNAVDGAAIERSVTKGLKDFQRRTVDYVFKRLYTDPKPVDRFLVADEVGLGKTLVARGLVARAINRLQQKGVKRIDVIYICSNADIAAQNIRRLNVTGRSDFSLSSRITLLPLQLRKLNQNGLNFVSFTPGTSFEFGQRTGQAAERALLFRLLEHAWGKQAMNRTGAYRLMRASKRLDRFREQVKWTPSKVGTGDGQIDPTLARSFVDELEKAEKSAGLKTRFFELVAIHARSEPGNYWHQRQEIVAELRRLLARSCIAALEPDLIILDEFQRFRHLLEPPNPDDPDDIRSLAHELFSQQDAKVLMLSATPYKMYTLSDEVDDDHYRDFVQTSAFLLGPDAAAGFGRDLTAFRRALYHVGDGLDLDEAIRLKSRIERRLRSVMARTERLSVTEDRSGMLALHPSTAMQLEPGDLSSFLLTDELSRKLGTGDALEYWKSAPYLTNFMEGYKLKQEIREAIGDGPKRNTDVVDLLHSAAAGGLLSFDQIRAYEQVDPGNARLRSLMADTIDRGTWQLLWMPPSMPYYEPGPPFDEPQLAGFTKRLIFSSWQVAPQAISVLMSYEAERRMVRKGHRRRINTPEARQRQRGLLRFARDSRTQERLVGMPVFALLYPSPTLARLGDPLQMAAAKDAGLPSREAVIESVKMALRRRLRPLLPRHDDGPVDENWYWAAPLLLDAADDPALTDGWLGRPNAQAAWDANEVGSDAESAFGAHVDFARSAAHQSGAFGQPPKDLLDVLARSALAAPANVALRSLARAVGDPRRVVDEPVRDAAARIAWGFRALFNVPEVMALVRTAEGGDEAYWRAVLEYCFAGNLQAVLDEYLHVLPEWLGLVDHQEASQLADIAREVHDVVSVRAANYGVEELVDRDGALTLETQKLRARYALRFGVRATDEEASLHRAGLVRSAFNSPFWPFVLASTSLGQEGLDFHQYCHAVVHWNLPANPVDMEQREGRVHRYKGHAVRKNVAMQHSDIGFASRGRDPWARMFEAARPARTGRDRDLVPYWVYACEGGARIERYVPAMPLSRDAAKLERMRRSLAAYRLVFGQPRQEDMLAFLGDQLSPDRVVELAEKLRIDLTPR